MRAPFERPFRMRDVGRALRRRRSTRGRRPRRRASRPPGSASSGRDFAAPFAIRMAGRMLGLSLGDVARIDGFYAAFAGAMVYDGNPEPQRLADAARDELDRDPARRDRPQPGPGRRIRHLAGRKRRRGGPDDAEVAAQLRVIMFGAIETIQGSVMNTTCSCSCETPPSSRACAPTPSSARGGRRRGAAADPAGGVHRAVDARRCTIGGVATRRGRVRRRLGDRGQPRPGRLRATRCEFDVRRPNARHALSFSFGEHHCLGAHLARIETAVAVRRLLSALAGPGARGDRRAGRLCVSQAGAARAHLEGVEALTRRGRWWPT